jgi:hypothetical protein
VASGLGMQNPLEGHSPVADDASMTDADGFKLLLGPYPPSALKRGDRATCLFRDCLVVVTTWTAAHIPGRAAAPWKELVAATPAC